MINIFFIAIGGACGAVLRYLSSEMILKLISRSNVALASFPWPTFFVNIVGSLFAGILYYFIIKNFNSFDIRLKNFLLVGLLGGFTTFSAFSLDFFRLTTAGQFSQAFIYIFSSVLLSILAIFFGFYLTKLIFS